MVYSFSQEKYSGQTMQVTLWSHDWREAKGASISCQGGGDSTRRNTRQVDLASLAPVGDPFKGSLSHWVLWPFTPVNNRIVDPKQEVDSLRQYDAVRFYSWCNSASVAPYLISQNNVWLLLVCLLDHVLCFISAAVFPGSILFKWYH